MPDQRIIYDDDILDEVVLTGTVHLELLDTHNAMLIIDVGADRYLHMQVSDPWVLEHHGIDDLVQVQEPMSGCGHRWGQHCDGPCSPTCQETP